MRPKNTNPEENHVHQSKKDRRTQFPGKMRLTKKIKHVMAQPSNQGGRFGKKWFPFNND
jgi:hypothetical protein